MSAWTILKCCVFESFYRPITGFPQTFCGRAYPRGPGGWTVGRLLETRPTFNGFWSVFFWLKITPPKTMKAESFSKVKVLLEGVFLAFRSDVVHWFSILFSVWEYHFCSWFIQLKICKGGVPSIYWQKPWWFEARLPWPIFRLFIHKSNIAGRDLFFLDMGVCKNSGIPKMDGENDGKPYKMDDLGYTYFWKHPYVFWNKGIWDVYQTSHHDDVHIRKNFSWLLFQSSTNLTPSRFFFCPPGD